MKILFKTLWKVSLVVCLYINSSYAASLIYHDEASFLNATESLTLESFENEAATNDIDQTSQLVLDGFVLSSTATFGVLNQPAFGQSASDGLNFIGSIDGDTSTTLRFSNEINAFGINILDYGDFGSSDLLFSNGFENHIAAHPAQNGQHQFFGIISDVAFDTVNLSHTIFGESYGLDEVYYGGSASVPEPSTYALMVLGVLGLAYYRRTKK